MNEIGSEGCKLFAECIKQASLPWCRINLNGRIDDREMIYRESY